MPALGEEFRSAREARGLSLSDVAERLHIRSVYLAAIEDEDWKAIGAPVYVRGFMRTYARFLGLDAESAVARFSALSPSMAPPAAASRSEERSAQSSGSTADRSSPSLIAILAVLIAVGVVGYVAYAFVQYRAGGPAVPVAMASSDAAGETPATDASPADEAPVAAAPVASPTPAVMHGLHIGVTQTSWLRVTIDGTVATEGTFKAGTAKSYTGHLADVRVGNAGGVTIAVNGRPLGPLGKSGDVVERRFVLTGE
jgi:cytoskeletal protein RodZ